MRESYIGAAGVLIGFESLSLASKGAPVHPDRGVKRKGAAWLEDMERSTAAKPARLMGEGYGRHEGRLTAAQGRTVDFKNTVIIMTSNMGAERIQQHAREEDESFEQLKEDMMEIVRHHLRPEFVNRIDEIIVFRALTKEQIADIARLMLDRTKRRLRAQDIEVEFTEAAVELIAEEGLNFGLDRRVALVTGAASGLGAATARLGRTRGARDLRGHRR